MERSEVRVEARVRNNVLWHAIYDAYPSVAAFSRKHNLPHMGVGALLNLKDTPHHGTTGKLKPLARRLIRIFRMHEDDLFPRRLYEIEQTTAVVEVPMTALPPSSEELRCLLPGPDDVMAADDVRRVVHDALQTLTDREQVVLVRRFGLDGDDPATLREVGEQIGVQQERIRQIEAAALRKMRHPSRSAMLKENCINV